MSQKELGSHERRLLNSTDLLRAGHRGITWPGRAEGTEGEPQVAAATHGSIHFFTQDTVKAADLLEATHLLDSNSGAPCEGRRALEAGRPWGSGEGGGKRSEQQVQKKRLH